MACGHFGCCHVHGVSVRLGSHVHQDGPHAPPGDDIPDKGELFVLRVAGSDNVGFLHDILLYFGQDTPGSGGERPYLGKGMMFPPEIIALLRQNLRNVPGSMIFG
jgi:hypothetical protein